MTTTQRQQHWQNTYNTKATDDVSWFQDSLALIRRAAPSPAAAIVDVGGGASRLAETLLLEGYQGITVMDLSDAALAAAQTHAAHAADRIQWIAADATTWEPPQVYDVWHDRATFHFLVDEADRRAYLERLARALKPEGHVVMATFAPDGPETCSGLPVRRYDADSLARMLGPTFAPVSTQRHQHITPWGSPQAFQFSVFRSIP